MGLLSDALRWINPPARKSCDASVDTCTAAITCDLDDPHHGAPHWDKEHRIWWTDDEAVDW